MKNLLCIGMMLYFLGCRGAEQPVDREIISLRDRCAKRTGGEHCVPDSLFGSEFDAYIASRWPNLKGKQSNFCDETMFRVYVYGKIMNPSHAEGDTKMLEMDCSKFARPNFDSVDDELTKLHGPPMLEK